jgi:hypothetical protein
MKHPGLVSVDFPGRRPVSIAGALQAPEAAAQIDKNFFLDMNFFFI